MRTLYKLSVPISAKEEEATVQLLQDILKTSVSVETDIEKGTTFARAYLDKAPSQATLQKAFPRFSVRQLPHENWAESWKRHFKPIEIGSKLLIKPSWSQRKPKPKQAVVVLDPGLSFGTGQHPTTRFCLEQITAFRREGIEQAFLDVGTGSGILAIAAAKLGYAPVEAFDFDPDAVRIAHANMDRNKVSQEIRLSQKDVTSRPGMSLKKYDLVCANLISDLLLDQRNWLVKQLQRTGQLVLAGILKLQFSDIQKAYETAGLRMISSAAAKEWRSGAFEFARQKIPKK